MLTVFLITLLLYFPPQNVKSLDRSVSERAGGPSCFAGVPIYAKKRQIKVRFKKFLFFKGYA